MWTRRRLWGVLIAAVTLLAWLAEAGQPDTPPNWAQVDRASSWTCPTPTGTTGEWFTIPDLAVSITTTGNPVLLSINLTWIGYNPGSAFWLSPVIDGQRQPQRLDWQTCCGGGRGYREL
jgi:hypothetical protein